MKEMDDEELQKMLENKQQLPAGSNLNNNSKAYRALFDALGEEPANGLPYDFTAKVTRRISVETARSNDFKYNLLAAVVFIAAIAIACATLASFRSDTIYMLLKYKWILLLFPVAFVTIQYFDQKLIKARMFDKRS